MPKLPRPRRLSQAKQFAQIERISLFGAVARIGPVGLWLYASHYLRAATLVSKPEVPFEPVRYYLVCHAIELALKAYLSLHQVTMLELSDNPYGHNLDAILAAAEAKGLSTVVHLSDAETAEIRNATTYYNGKLFEYPAYGEALSAYPRLPNLELLLAAAIALIEKLDQPCRESQ